MIASEPILTWLSERGSVDGHSGLVEVDGVQFESLSYTPVPFMEGAEAVRKLSSAIRRPDRAVRRMARRVAMPKSDPHAVRITFEDGPVWSIWDWRCMEVPGFLVGGRFEPLDSGAEWLMVGVDYGEETPFIAQVGRMQAQRILVTDLFGQYSSQKMDFRLHC